MKRENTKTKLGLVEKAELLKSRVTKFEKFIATRYTPDQPLAAEVALEEVNGLRTLKVAKVTRSRTSMTVQ